MGFFCVEVVVAEQSVLAGRRGGQDIDMDIALALSLVNSIIRNDHRMRERFTVSQYDIGDHTAW